MNAGAEMELLYGLTIKELPSAARRFSLWMDESGKLQANPVSPAFGGGGFVVVPEDPDKIPSWEVPHA